MNGTPRTEGTSPRVVDRNHGLTSPAKPVWVSLDRLFIRDPGTPKHVNGAGVVMTGEVRGALTHWVPTVDGHWLARVSYPIQYADGRRELWLQDQLVPSYAVRPCNP